MTKPKRKTRAAGWLQRERFRAKEEIRSPNSTLEERVKQRTIELVTANENLRLSEAVLADFFSESPLGLISVGADGRILHANRAQLEMFGCVGHEVIGRPVAAFHADPEAAAAALGRLVKKEIVSHHRARLRRKDGSIRHVLIDAHGLWEHDRLLHSRWFVRDITRLKRLERELLEVGERERQRIGNDLHDGLGQQLGGLYYLATLLAKGLQEDASPRASEATRLARLLDESLELTRGLARGLQPVNPLPEGLMKSLHELAERTRELYRVDCRFHCPAPVLIRGHSAATHLYRIAQEAVSNAMKHGKPTRIRIKLATTPRGIVLGVRDNGRGLRRLTNRSRGMGLHIMRYRTNMLRGALAVHRHPRGGTEVTASVTREALFPSEKEIN